MTVCRDEELLSGSVLLEKIDKLRDSNIGQHVPLPQLVVVGDQSSGKSSLLESLSGYPFPKDQTLCTRYCTQITSRRADHDQVIVRINPGPHASEQHKNFVEGFKMKVSSNSEFRSQFESILKKANERMGLRTDLSAENGDVFSEDVLKIEINGPNEDYLTIIDVPGIFRTTTTGTTKDDMTMVKDMVRRYIKDERTIILAVLPGNADIATQEILTLAEEYDKQGERTLGVLTKPDLVIEKSMQASVCNLVLGKQRPVTLGYFLVRNRGADSEWVDQSELDKIFRQDPWIDLPRDRVGIPALKSQLRKLLEDITRREFPKLVRDVDRQIKECKRELNSLGPARSDEREQRNFLSLIARRFQEFARAAKAADWNADPSFDRTEMRLITNIVNLTDVFAADFQQYGHSRRFKCPSTPPPIVDDNIDNRSDYSDAEVLDRAETLRALLLDEEVYTATDEDISELGELIVYEGKISRPKNDVAVWINEVYFKFRGLDLGTFNSNLVAKAFAEQSRNWDHLTNLYLGRVILIIHRFIAAALRTIYPDDQSFERLWSALLDEIKARYRKAKEQARLLIEIEKRKPPYTLNKQFAESLLKARANRMTEILRAKARKDTKQYGEVQLMVNLDDIASPTENMSNIEQLQEEIHDILQSYYSLALDRFVDNVFQLPVDYYLLHGPSSPLNVFTQEWVLELEPKQLDRIAGEGPAARGRRTTIGQKMRSLTEALKILHS